MIGIGIQPAGVTIAGLGDVEPIVPLPIPESGAPHLTMAGDYVINPTTGDIGRDPSARHRVLLAMRTLRTSATADSGFGIQLPGIIDDTFDATVRQAVTLALTSCTSDGSVRLDDILIEQVGGRAQITIMFTDMLRQASDEVKFYAPV